MIYLGEFEREVLDLIDDSWKTHVADIARALDTPPSLVQAQIERLQEKGFVEQHESGLKEWRTTEAGKMWLAEWQAARRFKRIKRWAARVAVLAAFTAFLAGYWKLYQLDQQRIAEHHCERTVEQLIKAGALDADVEVDCS